MTPEMPRQPGNPFKCEMDCLLDEIRDYEQLECELNQMPTVAADRRHIHRHIQDLYEELAHYEIAREQPEG